MDEDMPAMEWEGQVWKAAAMPFMHKLASGIPRLDAALEGGFPLGAMSECGMPMGRGGRRLLLPFVSQATRREEEPSWIIWIMRSGPLKVFPPAWLARGVDPRYWVVATSDKPLEELHRVFVRPFFRFIILDAPERLSAEDCAFLNRQARKNRQAIVILRPYFLSHKQGNVWARLRLNAWWDSSRREFSLQVLRGLTEKSIRVPEECIDPSDQGLA